MKKKNTRIWIGLFCLLLVMTGGVVYASSGRWFFNREDEPNPEDGEEYCRVMESRKAAITGVTVPEIEISPYERYIGDSRIVKDRQGLSENHYIKQILILENKIPADAPYLTKEKAIEICNGLTDFPKNTDACEQMIINAFNEVAFAPDFQGGSGITRTVYYTDETHSKAIIVTCCRVLYRDYDMSDNASEFIFSPFGED